MKNKAAGAVLDFPISWTLAAAETISTSTWSVDPAVDGGVAVQANSPAINGAVTRCLLTGGVFRKIYVVTNSITTNQGRTLQQTITLRIGTSEVTG